MKIPNFTTAGRFMERKMKKMRRRIKKRGASCLKGGAAKRWAWLVAELA